MSIAIINNDNSAFSHTFNEQGNLEKNQIISDISDAIILMGWYVETYDNSLKSEYGYDILAQKGSGKVAINVCFDAIDMAKIKHRQAALKEVGIRGLWLLKPCDGAMCAIDDRIDYSSNQIPIFHIMQNRGVTLIHGIQYFDDAEFGDESGFHEVPLNPYSFAYLLFNKELSFKRHYDNEVFLHCVIQDKTCFKCQKSINTINKIVYTRRIFGQFIHEDYAQACDVREVPESEIALINSTLSHKYNFAPIKSMFSKFSQAHYMANSCGHCGVIMGAFFESTDYDQHLMLTDMIPSQLNAESCFWDYELDDSTGAWILSRDSELVDNIIEDLLDIEFIDFDENGYYPLWFSLLALPDYEDDDYDEDD